jgi:hypothetical protein
MEQFVDIRRTSTPLNEFSIMSSGVTVANASVCEDVAIFENVVGVADELNGIAEAYMSTKVFYHYHQGDCHQPEVPLVRSSL